MEDFEDSSHNEERESNVDKRESNEEKLESNVDERESNEDEGKADGDGWDSDDNGWEIDDSGSESTEDEGESTEDEGESDEDERENNEDGEETDDYEWESKEVPFQSDVENVEFPLSWVAGRSEVAKGRKVHPKYVPHLRLYLLGDELCDDVSNSAADTGVDSLVWQTLPEILVKEVLLRLPAAAQARCRAVCKAWLAMLSTPEFSRRSFLLALSRTPTPLCAVTYCPNNRSLKYRRRIPPLLKTLKVDLSFLPEVFLSSGAQLHDCSQCGFMCISLYDDEGFHLCVLNPLSQSFKVLPLLQNVQGFGVYLLMGPVTATESIPNFKVYVPLFHPGTNRHNRLFKDFAIYSSISGEWKGFLGGLELDQEAGRPPARACNGDLYTVVYSTPPRLVRLSTERGPRYLWDVALPHFDRRRDEGWEGLVFLVVHRGRLLCCCSGIWMLDEARQQWVVIAKSCPPDILPPTPDTHIAMLENVVVAGDLVVFFFALFFHRRNNMIAHGNHRNILCPVAYDMRQALWRKLPQAIIQFCKTESYPNLLYKFGTFSTHAEFEGFELKSILTHALSKLRLIGSL